VKLRLMKVSAAVGILHWRNAPSGQRQAPRLRGRHANIAL